MHLREVVGVFPGAPQPLQLINRRRNRHLDRTGITIANVSTAAGGFASNEGGRVVRDVTPISALSFPISLFPRVATSIAPITPVLPIGASYVVRVASGISTDRRNIAVASKATALMIPFTVTR